VEDIIRMQRETVEEHIRQENSGNWQGVFDTFIPDETAFYDVIPFNTRFAGFDGVKGFYGAASAAFPDLKIDVWGEYDSPGCSVREVTISGTHTGDWSGMPGTGRHVRFQLAGFFLFGSGGKLLAERIYFDNDTVVRQIRGEMEASSVVDFPLPEMSETRSGN
jgi:predicted ester cyclase